MTVYWMGKVLSWCDQARALSIGHIRNFLEFIKNTCECGRSGLLTSEEPFLGQIRLKLVSGTPCIFLWKIQQRLASGTFGMSSLMRCFIAKKTTRKRAATSLFDLRWKPCNVWHQLVGRLRLFSLLLPSSLCQIGSSSVFSFFCERWKILWKYEFWKIFFCNPNNGRCGSRSRGGLYLGCQSSLSSWVTGSPG